jgi:aspartate/methionine/tyrosine aminotransferase
MNPQAVELNNAIVTQNRVVFKLLTKRGKNIFFPKEGILGQTADAKGKKINATIGIAVEDDNSPMRLPSIEKQINLDPSMAFPYAPSFGRPGIRKRWKEMIYEKNPSLAGKEISLPIVSNALTHALSIVAHMFLRKKDTLVVSDLFWGNYNLIFTHAFGATISKFNLFDEGKFDLKSFEESIQNIQSKKKVILLNFPNNPTGYTPTLEETDSIINILKSEAEKGNRLVVIMDDAYFGLVYQEGIAMESIFARLADLHKNLLAVKVDGATKEDYVWGFRVGFITYGIKNGTKELYNALEAKTAGAVRGNISNACNLSQSLLLNAFTSPSYQQEKEDKFKILKARYDKVKEVLRDSKYENYFKPYPFNSGYFMCIRLKKGLDGEQIRKILLDKYDTGLINLNNVFRIAFSAAAEKDIPALFENIYLACKDFEGGK